MSHAANLFHYYYVAAWSFIKASSSDGGDAHTCPAGRPSHRLHCSKLTCYNETYFLNTCKKCPAKTREDSPPRRSRPSCQSEDQYSIHLKKPRLSFLTRPKQFNCRHEYDTSLAVAPPIVISSTFDTPADFRCEFVSFRRKEMYEPKKYFA